MGKLCLSLILSLLLFQCGPPKMIDNSFDLSTQEMPNGMVLYDNVNVDRSEVTNIDYKEYLSWTGRIFGLQSEEYKSALPDTTVWEELDSELGVLTKQYFRHQYFDKFPVVGISYQQATDFSNWRADRVFEMSLIEHYGYENTTHLQTATTRFSIAGYFARELKSFPLNKNVKYYPVFRLPSEQEWRKILQKHTEDIKATFEECDSPECKDCITNNYRYQVNIPAISNVETEIFPVSSVDIGCHTDAMLTHVIGNVAEWSQNVGFTFGSSWKDNSNIARLKANTCLEPNAWTGFRNISYWQAVKE